MYYFHRQPFDVRVYATACIYKFPYFLHLIIQPPGGTLCLGNELYDSVGYSAAKSLQSCPTLSNPMDCSPPGSSVHGIFQVRVLEWVAISFSNAWKWKWSHSVMSDSLRPHGLQPTRLLRPWDFPGKSTGVGCHWLLWLGTLASWNFKGPFLCHFTCEIFTFVFNAFKQQYFLLATKWKV